jgi:hypothetical protein
MALVHLPVGQPQLDFSIHVHGHLLHQQKLRLSGQHYIEDDVDSAGGSLWVLVAQA